MRNWNDIPRWHTKRRPESMGTVLDEVVAKGTPLGKARWLMRILREWPAAVGEENAKNHQPLRFFYKDGILTVASKSAMHAAAMQPYWEEVRKRLNRAFGRTIVKQIRTQQSSGMNRRDPRR